MRKKEERREIRLHNSCAISLILLLLIPSIFFSCSNDNPKPESNSLKGDNNFSANSGDSIKKESPDSGECLTLIWHLVDKSGIRGEIPGNFIVSFDDTTTEVYTLRIATRNEETQSENAIKWAMLNIKTKQLLDITADPDNPAPIACDENVLINVMNCLGHK
jgi:hypothetical protein